MKLSDPSLDQLRIFLAVVEHGSFGGAARAMGRAISAISYGVAQLERQLAVSLFEREGSRKPVLTHAGEGLLAEARVVADSVDALLAKTHSLHAGLESSVGLVVDVMVPAGVTARVLREFRRMFPTVALTLNIEGLGAVVQCLLEEEAELGIAGPEVAHHPAFERQVIGAVDLIPVSSPDHPLARAMADGPVRPGLSRQHMQLVLADRSDLTQGREFAVLSPQTWRLGDLGAKHSLLKEGLGWGNMPRDMVQGDLEAGRLVDLDLPEKPGAHYKLAAMWRRDTKLGPASGWLIDAFREALTEPAA